MECCCHCSSSKASTSVEASEIENAAVKLREEGILDEKEDWIYEYYKKITGRKVPEDKEDFDFEIEMSCCTKESKVMDKCKLLRLPNCRKVRIGSMIEVKQDVLLFLAYGFPDQTKLFQFNVFGDYKLLKIDSAIDQLEQSISKVQKEVAINYCDLTKKQFERLFKASYKTSRVIFSCSKIDLSSDLDLEGPEYSISYLGFNQTGEEHGNNWKNQPEKFERLIKAISMTSMKSSIETINIFKCGLNIEEVKTIFSNYDMESVNVIDKNTPLSSC